MDQTITLEQGKEAGLIYEGEETVNHNLLNYQINQRYVIQKLAHVSCLPPDDLKDAFAAIFRVNIDSFLQDLHKAWVTYSNIHQQDPNNRTESAYYAFWHYVLDEDLWKNYDLTGFVDSLSRVDKIFNLKVSQQVVLFHDGTLVVHKKKSRGESKRDLKDVIEKLQRSITSNKPQPSYSDAYLNELAKKVKNSRISTTTVEDKKLSMSRIKKRMCCFSRSNSKPLKFSCGKEIGVESMYYCKEHQRLRENIVPWKQPNYKKK
eukprot:TRINITY_DN1301_c0_g1_i1.p1 TRINITY_DN1301_c0_g1~~TRINITY_DN1301_c0_g1_i1.p1  ORF type:complete len:292 (+),score=37.86 TRINITY_DN1301_c0_g1_i1:93-878(+)